MIRYGAVLIVLFISIFPAAAQEHPDDLSLGERLQPVSPDNLFRTPGYTVHSKLRKGHRENVIMI